MEYATLNNGQKVPMLGLGTWKSAQGEVQAAVEVAIAAGYRHIDCAWAYGNENEVGAALAAKTGDGTVKREELFVTSKLWNTFHRSDCVRKGCQSSLERLGLQYLDLFLMHWPVALKEDMEQIPKDKDGNLLFSDADYLDTYKEMEKLVDEGLVRAIGMSNFNSQQTQRVLDNCRIKPAMMQVEINPRMNNQQLVEFCKSRDIHVTAYSPLGSPDRPWAAKDEKKLVDDPAIVAIAHKHGMSPGQVLIRFALDRGLLVLPKSVTPARITDNLKAVNFKLDEEDMKTIMGMHTGERAVLVAHWGASKYYPFVDSVPF